MSTRFLPVISRGWLAEELYGWRAAPTISKCRVPFLYAKAMLSATGADAPRRTYVAGMLAAHFGGEADADLLNFVRHCSTQFDAESAAEKVVGPLAGQSARVVVYDAMTAACDAGSACRSSSAADVAASLGVSASTTAAIADVCERESALEARRRKLLFGDECSLMA